MNVINKQIHHSFVVMSHIYLKLKKNDADRVSGFGNGEKEVNLGRNIFPELCVSLSLCQLVTCLHVY